MRARSKTSFSSITVSTETTLETLLSPGVGVCSGSSRSCQLDAARVQPSRDSRLVHHSRGRQCRLGAAVRKRLREDMLALEP